MSPWFHPVCGNKAFHCEYVRSWLKIKKRWGLGIPKAELKAIKKVLKACP